MSAWQVRSMSLKGPALTTYHPCGLGLLHFDKLLDNTWKGVLHFGLYTNLIEADIVINFQKESTITGDFMSTNVEAQRTNKYSFIVHAVLPLPNKFTFYISTDQIAVNETDVPTVTYLSFNNITLCNDQIKASQTVKSLNVTERFSSNYAHVCGRRALDHEEVVSVRTEAKAGDWPWHVAIFIRNNNNGLNYFCGGNIVSRTAIVTAGHCVFKAGALVAANRILVVAGTSTHKDISHIGRQALNAVEVILHPAYHDDYSTADLAIIRVHSFKFTEYVQPICLWGPVYDKYSLFGKEATVVGFGSTEYNKQSETLRSTYTMVQNDTICVTFSPTIYARLLNEFTFCAGYGPASTINPRNGDSGGGLVIPTIQNDHKVSWFLRGILSKCGVSPGHQECDPKYYVVYTDVAPHYGWIYHHAGLQFRSNVLVS
ncbi:unnamed protein product [Arctia plantaginis]|uniref:Peptidase S1 domain-containing protein n=1 Tax=Arctia plantaginis TaxID=874455 RepID=A0A8S1A4L1_ARCPL|nr:unnamed protein product [Arctia plantaginis]CAB3257817.1 unnamed protein product [Arctia plantaginis]